MLTKLLLIKSVHSSWVRCFQREASTTGRQSCQEVRLIDSGWHTCVPSPSGCRYLLLHNSIQSSVFVTDTPQRVGTLLDYQHGCLSFYDAGSGRLLGTFRERFTEPCRPALGLEQPGSLQLCMVQELPQFAKDS
ncbi:hypothetical protein OJAV_G00090290 [Oryzias javanicus]|uniref:B30.2/SPRY domain-containing protein n=1 Tax=Oryzias javanicus TaxID=123683 RepID=A0A437CZX4_ORYJA|nr:hypothetical protein OJAV_G00090290 [Oryzias javanicus]